MLRPMAGTHTSGMSYEEALYCSLANLASDTVADYALTRRTLREFCCLMSSTVLADPRCTTSGNNVISFKGDLANTTQSQTRLLEIFTPRANFETSPTTTENVDAGRVNTFYITNELHDIWYLYGFTETSYNFQNDNFGKGGAGNDRVQVSVQDSQGFNNA